jgi:TatD DNase family protein
VWLDSHCHVTADEFEADRAEVLARAREDGVEAFVAIGSGYGVERNDRAVRLTESEPDVFATAGVHPHEANTLDAVGRGKLADWLAHPRVVAVGECGLDYHYTHSPREVQREVFAEQLASARERGLPVTIHVRGDDAVAYDDLLDLWRAEGRGELEGVLLRDVARELPIERLLVETDAPLLSPEGFRGKRNEPARVRLVGETLAATRGVPVEEVADATTRNARRLFRLPDA